MTHRYVCLFVCLFDSQKMTTVIGISTKLTTLFTHVTWLLAAAGGCSTLCRLLEDAKNIIWRIESLSTHDTGRSNDR
jgi:hypothetical protein